MALDSDKLERLRLATHFLVSSPSASPGRNLGEALEYTMRKILKTSMPCLIVVLSSALSMRAQQSSPERGGLDVDGPYRVVENWFKPGVEGWNQPVTGVAIDNPNRIFVVSSGQQITEPGSLILGPDGTTLNPVRDWSATKLQHPTHEHLILVLN